MTEEQLSVRLNEEPLGYLQLVGGSKMRFKYLDSASRQLSLSMPLRKVPYANRHCEAFFGGLLPESQRARQELGALLDVHGNNSYGILEAIGFDCAGAVSLRKVDDPVLKSAEHKVEGSPVTDKEFAALLKELPKRPLLAGVHGMRISLAGAQDKTAICLLDDQICFPINGSPTTHIVKPPIVSDDVEDSVQNEYFCMNVAKLVDLRAPSVEIRSAAGIPFALIERFDRRWLSQNLLIRVHQEDFCQAMGILPWEKYQVNGGPTLQQCFYLLRHTEVPAISRTQLIRAVVFNYLIGNLDAHGKNFSVLHETATKTILAPVYDLMSTAVYPKLDKRMAMAIGRQYYPNQVFKANWQELCERIEFGFRGFALLALELADRTVAAARLTRQSMKESGVHTPIVDRLCDVIARQTAFLSVQLKS